MPRECGWVRLAVLLQEAIAGLVQHPGRSVLTASGTVIGVTVLVVVLGLTTSVSIQVTAQPNLVGATEVRVIRAERSRPRVVSPDFPIDTAERAMRINDVRSTGLQWELKQRAAKSPETRDARAIAVSAGTFEVAGATFSQRRGFDAGHEQRGARVAAISSGIARDLRIGDLSRGPTVVIDGVPFTVVGIIDDTKRLPELFAGVITPTRTAQALWHDPPPEVEVNLVVDVAPGAAQVVGPQLFAAMPATYPERFSVSPLPSPKGLRAAVSSQPSGLFLGLGVVCLIVGMIGIANTTIVAVIECTGEIGLQRAMDAQPRHIVAQFLLEAAVLGGLGGPVETSLGVVVVVGICAALTWTVVVSPLLVAAESLVGLVVGTLAGIYPSLRASHLEPVEALRYRIREKPARRRGSPGGVSGMMQTRRIRVWRF